MYTVVFQPASPQSYVSPGFSESSEQHTTCRDVSRLYKAVMKTDFFREVVQKPYHISPDGGDERSVSSDASILNPQSPYYFKYANDAKYSFSEKTYANLVVTTTYHNMTYMFVGLLGLNESEKNVYADARKLVTWAYLNLSDRKLLDDREPLAKVEVKSGWGDYNMDLYTDSVVYKTLPNDFESRFLTLKSDVPESVTVPIKKGTKIGDLTVSYDDHQVDKVSLIVDSDEGLDMLGDSARFGNYVIDGLLGDNAADSDKDKGSDKESDLSD